jgi:hypothetical protein
VFFRNKVEVIQIPIPKYRSQSGVHSEIFTGTVSEAAGIWLKPHAVGRIDRILGMDRHESLATPDVRWIIRVPAVAHTWIARMSCGR